MQSTTCSGDHFSGWRSVFWRPVWIFWHRASYCVLSSCVCFLRSQRTCCLRHFLFRLIFCMLQWVHLFSCWLPASWVQDASVFRHNPVSLIQGQVLLQHVVLVRDTGYRPSNMATMLAHRILNVVLCKFCKSAENLLHLSWLTIGSITLTGKSGPDNITILHRIWKTTVPVCFSCSGNSPVEQTAWICFYDLKVTTFKRLLQSVNMSYAILGKSWFYNFYHLTICVYTGIMVVNMAVH